MLVVVLLFSCLFLSNQARSITAESFNASFLSNLLESFRGPNAINITQFLTTFQLPTCMKQCLPELDGLLIALLNSNDTQDMTKICSELQSSTNCASSVGCSKIFTDAAASAFQFACLENIQTIAESVDCVRNTALDIQPECEAHCEVQSKLLEDASKNNMEAIFDVPRVCNSTRCLLICFKEKIDKQCKIGHRNFLETLLKTVTHGENNGMEEAIGWVMPDYCRGNKSLSESVKFSSTDKPISVGKVSNSNKHKSQQKEKTTSKKQTMTKKLQPEIGATGKDGVPGVRETTLIIDGETRILRYVLLDSQKRPVPSPDFETFTKAMAQQFSPSLLSSTRPKESVLLKTIRSNKAPKENPENSTTSEEDLEVTVEKTPDQNSKDVSEISHSNDDEVRKEGVGLTIGLVVFVATVIYWMWETARDMN